MATSLDEEIWTFYSAAGTERFTIPTKVAKLSGTFKAMIDHSENEEAVSLQVVNQTVDGSDEVYQINTDRFLKYVYDYFKIWEDAPEKADYVSVGPVQTSEISHILLEKDILFIQNYLSREIPEIRGTETEIRRNRIETLGKLLSQVDEFLDIRCLANKIYAYIAVLVWNTSIVDFSEALRDPAFKAAQDAAIAQWERDNPNKFATYVRSHTTGSSYLVPQPMLDITDEDLISFNEIGDGNEDLTRSDPEQESEPDPEPASDPEPESESDQESE